MGEGRKAVELRSNPTLSRSGREGWGTQYLLPGVEAEQFAAQRSEG